MPDNPNKLSQFWKELKRRRVIHVIIVYATAAFIIVELVNNVFEPLRLPEWTPTLVILILAIGFPIALIFSWIFDVTVEGIFRGALPYYFLILVCLAILIAFPQISTFLPTTMMSR